MEQKSHVQQNITDSITYIKQLVKDISALIQDTDGTHLEELDLRANVLLKRCQWWEDSMQEISNHMPVYQDELSRVTANQIIEQNLLVLQVQKDILNSFIQTLKYNQKKRDDIEQVISDITLRYN